MEAKRSFEPDLGLFIHTIICNSGMSHEAIAESLNVSPRAVDYYCSGQRKPRQTILLKLLRITGVKTEDIPF